MRLSRPARADGFFARFLERAARVAAARYGHAFTVQRPDTRRCSQAPTRTAPASSAKKYSIRNAPAVYTTGEEAYTYIGKRRENSQARAPENLKV